MSPLPLTISSDDSPSEATDDGSATDDKPSEAVDGSSERTARLGFVDVLFASDATGGAGPPFDSL